VHDARLAAAMRVHELSRIVTFNIAHFSRYLCGTIELQESCQEAVR